jgi:hypothetical protein
MTEGEIRKIIEAHIEKIFHEIWSPIESKLRAQIHDVDKNLNEINAKDVSLDKKYAKVRGEFRIVKNLFDKHLADTAVEMHEIRKNFANIKKDTLHEVKDTVKLAVELGQKAQELKLPMEDKIKSFDTEVKDITVAAKAMIKNECDLRIIEILELRKKYEELLRLSDKTLRQHELYKNVEEPTKIII